MFKRDKILVYLLLVLAISISFQFIGKAEEIPSSLYVDVKTDREVYMLGEEINFTVSLINNDVYNNVTLKLTWYMPSKPLFRMYIYDSNNKKIYPPHVYYKPQWLKPLWPNYYNVTVNASSKVTQYFRWDTKQITPGIYKAVFAIPLNNRIYFNSSSGPLLDLENRAYYHSTPLEGIKYFAIYPRPPKHDITGWVYLTVGLVLIICCLSVIIAILFSRRRKT
ncbi:MAG: hypothetical protein J7K62_02110 [Thermoplasmata archaeon]|nr:hypothetical protein [Thermoplasmata archaeon]